MFITLLVHVYLSAWKVSEPPIKILGALVKASSQRNNQLLTAYAASLPSLEKCVYGRGEPEISKLLLLIISMC